MLNSNIIRLLASLMLAASFLGTTACSKDGDSGDNQAKGSIVQKPGKGPNSGTGNTGGGTSPVIEIPGGDRSTITQPGEDDGAGTFVPPHPIDGPNSGNGGGTALVPPTEPGSDTGTDTGTDTGSGTDTNNGSGGSDGTVVANPTEPGGTNGSDGGTTPVDGGNSGTDTGNAGGNTTDPADPGSDPSQPGDGQMSEEQIYTVITEAFVEYIPLGTYKGQAENGQSCTVTVKPFAQQGKDLSVTIETSGGTNGAGNDKLTVNLAPNQNASIIGVPKEDPPLMRMWIELAIPSFGMMGPKQAVQLLSVRFDPQTKKAQKIYIFDQTREGLGNTSINCAVSSFTPPAAP